MKTFKRIILLVLVALLVFSAAGCKTKKQKEQEELERQKAAAIENAKSFVKNLYINDANATASDYEVVGQIAVGGTTYEIEWTIEIVSGNAEDVKVTKSEDGTKAIIDVNENAQVATEYKLVAKIKGTDVSVSFNHTVPAFKYTSYAEWLDACKKNSQDALIVKGYVIAVVGGGSSSAGSFYFQDAEGHGYYAYNPSTKLDLEYGDEVLVKGTGTVYGGQYEFNKNCTVEKTGEKATTLQANDGTADWAKAKGQDDEALIPYQNALVKLTGCTMANVDGSYYYFTVGNSTVKFNLYDTYYFLTEAQRKAITDQWEAGKTFDIVGIVSVYSKLYQIYPISEDCLSNVAFPQLGNAEAVATVKDSLGLTQVKFENDTELAVDVKGYNDQVSITWASNSEQVVFNAETGKLVITLGDADVEVTVTATLTAGEATDTKEFKLTLLSASSDIYVPKAVEEAKAGTYKFALYQATLGKYLYADGTVNSSEYLATTEKADKAADFVVALVEGKTDEYTIKVGDKFVEVYETEGQKVRIHLVDTATGAWKFDATLKVFTYTLTGCAKDSNNNTYYLGTYNNYNTMSASATSYISGDNASKVGVSQFPATFGKLVAKQEGEEPEPDTYVYVGAGTAESPYTVEDALHKGAKLSQSNYGTAGEVVEIWVRGFVVVQGTDAGEKSNNLELATTADGTAKLLIYTVNETATIKDVRLNDEVVIHGYLMNWNGKVEVSSTKVDGADVYPEFVSCTRGSNPVAVSTESSDKAEVKELSAQRGLNGSTFTFKVDVTSGFQIVAVKVNGEAIEAADGVYTGTILGPTAIVVETAEAGVQVQKATVNMVDFANEHKDVLTATGKQITSATVANGLFDLNVTRSESATSNNSGKMYGTFADGTWTAANWRIYKSEDGTLTISVANGKNVTITKVIVTYTASANGAVFQVAGANYESGTAIDVTNNTISFVAAGTGNCQVTAIEITYQASGEPVTPTDTTKPVITISDAVMQALAAHEFVEGEDASALFGQLLAGITATDDVDGQITVTQEMVNLGGLTIDNLVAGDYTITITVTDAAGNAETKTLPVHVAKPAAKHADEDLLADLPKSKTDYTSSHWIYEQYQTDNTWKQLTTVQMRCREKPEGSGTWTTNMAVSGMTMKYTYSNGQSLGVANHLTFNVWNDFSPVHTIKVKVCLIGVDDSVKYIVGGEADDQWVSVPQCSNIPYAIDFDDFEVAKVVFIAISPDGSGYIYFNNLKLVYHEIEKHVFNASELTAGDITADAVVADYFTVHATSGKKMVVDGSNKSIDGLTLTQRVKFSGASAAFGTERYIEFTATKAARIKVYALSSSSSDSTRRLALYNENGDMLQAYAIDGANIACYTYEVVAGKYYFGCPDNAVNIYYIEVAEGATIAKGKLVGVKVTGADSAKLALNAETGLYEGQFAIARQWGRAFFTEVYSDGSTVALTYNNATFSGDGVLAAKAAGSPENCQLFADTDDMVAAGEFCYGLSTKCTYKVTYNPTTKAVVVTIIEPESELTKVSIAGDATADLTLNAETGLYEGQFTLSAIWKNVHFNKVFADGTVFTLKYANTTFAGDGIKHALVEAAPWTQELYQEHDTGDFFLSKDTATTYDVTYDPQTKTLTVNIHVEGATLTGISVAGAVAVDLVKNEETGLYEGEFTLGTIWNQVHFVANYSDGNNATLTTASVTIAGNAIKAAKADGATYTTVLFADTDDMVAAGSFCYSLSTETKYAVSYDPQAKLLVVDLVLPEVPTTVKAVKFGGAKQGEFAKQQDDTYVAYVQLGAWNRVSFAVVDENDQEIALWYSNAKLAGAITAANKFGDQWAGDLYHESADGVRWMPPAAGAWKFVYDPATKTMTVAKYTDQTAPVITIADAVMQALATHDFVEDEDASALFGQLLAGISAKDELDGAIAVTQEMVNLGGLNPAKLVKGDYTITITVTDAAGNAARKELKLHVRGVYADVDLLADLPNKKDDYISSNWKVDKYSNNAWVDITSVQMRCREKPEGSGVWTTNMACGYNTVYRYKFSTGKSLGIANTLSLKYANDFSGATDVKVKVILIDKNGNSVYALGTSDTYVTVAAGTALTPIELTFSNVEVKEVRFVLLSSNGNGGYFYVGDAHLTYEEPAPSPAA